jgi:hypothetical protein
MAASLSPPFPSAKRRVFASVALVAILMSGGCKKEAPPAPPEPVKKSTSVDSLLQNQAPADQAQPAPTAPTVPPAPDAAQPAETATKAKPASDAFYDAKGYAPGTYIPPIDPTELDNWNSFLRQFYRNNKRFPRDVAEVAAAMQTQPLRVPAGYSLVVDKERQEFILTKNK